MKLIRTLFAPNSQNFEKRYANLGRANTKPSLIDVYGECDPFLDFAINDPIYCQKTFHLLIPKCCILVWQRLNGPYPRPNKTS